MAAPDIVRAFRGVRLLGGKELLHEGVQTVAEASGALGERHRASCVGVGVNFERNCCGNGVDICGSMERREGKDEGAEESL